MLSNTSCSDLKLVEKVSVLSGGYQQKFQFSTSISSNTNNNNNNNDISNNKNMSLASTTLQPSTKPFTFYTSGGVAGGAVVGGCTPTSECTTIIIQRNSSKEIAKNPPIGGLSTDQSNERIHYEPCSYYNSQQENELTKKICNNFRNDSALNGVSGGGRGSVGVGDVVTTEKTTGDTSNSCSSSNSSNSSSKSNKSDRQKSPMCRTEDQENAFRQIEDVHNYSKLNRFGYCNGRSSGAANLAMYSSNSSNQDEDEDDEEEEDEGEEEEEIEDDEDDDLDYEHLHAKVRKLSAIGRQSEKVVKSVVPVNSAGQKQQQMPEIGLEVEDKIEPKMEDEGSKIPPDHHARRPMNAFLIFCKRHRGIVKNKYKNFENRAITKILGEWWASLDANDKKCYVNLAKQNKDAFFSAHPNFKWYKLPAPSLRTLNTRPGNIERPLPGSSEYQCDLNDSPTQGTLLDHTVTSRCEPKKVSYFKLADETQMGELNSLMRPTATPSTTDALQEALGETSDYFKTGCKRKSSNSFEYPPNTSCLQRDNSFSSSEDDLTPKKSDRSCKGKKYQELINSGQIAAVTPKKQVISKPSRMTNSRNSSCSISQQYVNGHCSKVTATIIEEPKKDEHTNVVEGQYLLPDSPGSYGSPSKQHFSFVSFDLEDKIRALPAQCLETYLQRKKNTKRKKKINSKKRPPTQLKTEGIKATSQLHQPKTAQEAKEQMVGSQKRKARKESITRRDINSVQNDVQVLLSSSSVNPILVSGGVSEAAQTLIAVSHNATSDLLILAEVAANHTGIAQ